MSGLSWPTTSNGSMRMHMPQLPAMNFCEQDVRRGAVKMIARSPSGRTQTLKIQADSSGQFTTNFTPNEVGDWMVSIMHDNKNIEGSPFTIRVYDPGRVKVFGLQDSGDTGGPVQFSVDTSEAGDGEIAVAVTYDARQMATRVNQSGQLYHVSFMPEGPGVYNIEVEFAGMEVTGSPFAVQISDPPIVTVLGDPLEFGQRGQKASFMIDTAVPAAVSDINVTVSPPRGAKLPVDIVKTSDTVFRIEFIPSVVGDHTVDITLRDNTVDCSPFMFKVYDNAQIIVSNIPAQSVLGKPVSFGINASESGNGRLDIVVNGGAVPCEVENSGARKFLATFVPESDELHVVRVFFNDVEVPGSPWQVEILSPYHVSTNAGELGNLMNNQPASFEIQAERDAEGRLSVTINGPDCCPLQNTITKNCDCCYEVQFTPRKIGCYHVTVAYEGMIVHGSPFLFCVFDPDAITICPVGPVACNELVEFTVDANGAGSGELSIVVNNGDVPSSARLIAKNVYAVSFVPTAPGIHTIELFFNCQPLKESPLMISVVDARLITYSGPVLVPVRKSATLKANTENAGKAELKATMTSPTDKDITVRVAEADPVGFKLEFMPLEVGPHQLGVVYGCQCPTIEPLCVMAYDASCIKVMGVKDGLVGFLSRFIVDLNKCGEGELDVSIVSSSGNPVNSQVTLLEAGRLEVTYTPEEAGFHFAEVMFNNEPVNASPFQFNVLDCNKVIVRGSGLDLVAVNEPASFMIVAPSAQIHDIDVIIRGPTGRQILPNVTEKRANNFLVEYTPKQSGLHYVDVHYFECVVPGSPFPVHVWDASQVRVSNVNKCGECGVEAFFHVELSDAGDGTVEITITDSNGQLIPHQIITVESSILEVHYTPMTTGIHCATITFNGASVPGSPVDFKVIDVSKVLVRGDGLGLVPVNRPASFVITAPDAKLSEIDVAITNPAGCELIPKITETVCGTFRVEYVPSVVGTYRIRIAYCCIEVSPCEFIAETWDVSRVLLADAGMGEVGVESSFKVIVSEAGKGLVEITLTDPVGHLVANQVVTAEPGVLEVVYMPKIAGMHRAHVLFNCEAVPCSPFSFLVIDVSNVSCWGDGLCPVPVCKPVCFFITAPHAKAKDIGARVIGPNGNEVMSRITETAGGSFRVEYTPTEAGEHFVSASYFGRPIPCCPASVQVWDVCNVRVCPIPMGFVGCESLFTLDARYAGEGKMDIAITDPNGLPLHSIVAMDGTGAYAVSYTPTTAGTHRVDIYFNSANVPGSPFHFNVADPDSVCVSLNGSDLVRICKTASFVIKAPGSQMSDFSVKITGPDGVVVNHRMCQSGHGEFTVEYTPYTIGEHIIDIGYFGEPICDSPFTVRAWDPAGVIVSNVTPGIISMESVFTIDASGAGSGCLTVTVTCRGEDIPSTVTTGTDVSDMEVSFVPKYLETHLINVCFNGETVKGSPFSFHVLDGRLATASVRERAIAQKPATFTIDTSNVEGASETTPLSVSILAPSGDEIEPVVEQTSVSTYLVTYVPEEPGCHTITVLYANSPISRSPFSVDVFNPSAVDLVNMPQCFVVGKPVSFKVNSCDAGNGCVRAKVKGPTTQPPVMTTDNDCLAALSFVPLETGEHLLFVTYDDVNIPGSPFEFDVVDPKSVKVNWDALHLKRVGDIVKVEVATDGSAIDNVISCIITDPFQQELVTEYNGKSGRHQFTFVPQDVGPHMIELMCDSNTVLGGPATCNVYDPMRVRVMDATHCADIGDEVEFSVDTSEAGFGDLDVSVTQSGIGVPVKRNQFSLTLARYSFTAKLPKQHMIHISFNGENIPGSPLALDVVNPANKMSLHYGNATTCVPVTQTVWATVNLAGYACLIPPEAIIPTVIAPTSDLLPAKVSQLTNGGVRVEYSSSIVGTHELNVEFGGQLIPGSPVITEICDPSKILLEGLRRGKVGEPMFVDVCLLGAGEAQLNITVTDPSGHNIAFDMEQTPNGQRVIYIPDCPGTHKVNATYCGINVPGCPIRQEIEAIVIAAASGCGLDSGIVDRMAEFVVDVKGDTGDLFAEVLGPMSVARTTIEPHNGKNFKVKYLPAEVGTYTITLLWNDVEVECSPFHPKIVDPTKVEVADNCLENWTAADRLKVKLDELYSLIFDCGGAGPGALTATVTGPRGDLQDFDLLPYNTDADNNADMFVLKFLPRCQGDYYIRAYWCNSPVRIFPIIATAVIPEPEPKSECSCDEVRAELVSVAGPGISFAYCHENADFVIDGHEAGPGEHQVKMVGLKHDIDVTCVPIEEGVFGCSYVPEVAGAYLLSVTWSGQHVSGSPFKVSVMSASDASKVTCSGDGLKSIVCGREGSVLIDTRSAGPGELVAECMGPTRAASCTLIDRQDGMFELVIKPREVGSHKLLITYGFEPVPGSPFCLKVTAPPNASMVKVSGDGIKNGLLATYQSTFVVDTRGAGPGQLTVKVRGRKGAFRVEMSRLPSSDRSIQCRYYPTEIGLYQVYVLWSGEHVPGSPFIVNIVDTMEELRNLAEQLEITVTPYNKIVGYGTTSSRSSTSSHTGNTLRGLMFTDDY